MRTGQHVQMMAFFFNITCFYDTQTTLRRGSRLADRSLPTRRFLATFRHLFLCQS